MIVITVGIVNIELGLFRVRLNQFVKKTKILIVLSGLLIGFLG